MKSRTPIKDFENPSFLPDLELKRSSDNSSSEFVKRNEPHYPPTSSFDVEVLSANGMLVGNQINSFIPAPLDDISDKSQQIVNEIIDNEPYE